VTSRHLGEEGRKEVGTQCKEAPAVSRLRGPGSGSGPETASKPPKLGLMGVAPAVTEWWFGGHAPITPNFPSNFNCEIVGDYVQI
jgi:hypothetical protein